MESPLPVTARIAEGTLSVGGVSATALAAEFGTPLLVYCGETLRAQARAYRALDPRPAARAPRPAPRGARGAGGGAGAAAPPPPSLSPRKGGWVPTSRR